MGLSTQEACGDTPRVILGCPLAGVTDAEVFDASPDIRAVAERFIGDPAFSNLPRKYKTSISGCRARMHEPRDQRRVVRGGWSTRAASSATTCRSAAVCRRTRCSPSGWVRSWSRDRVPEAWAGVTGLFREYGYRRSRNHARFKFLVKDWGAERVREVLEREFLERGPLPDGPRPAATPMAAIATIWASCRSATAGSRSGSLRKPGASPGTSYGSSPTWPTTFGERPVLATAQQKLVIVGVEPARADELVGELDDARPAREAQLVPAGHDGVHRHRVLQARDRRDEGPRRAGSRASWRQRLPDFDEDVRIHVNGCPNSCARFQVADIGLMSALQVAARRHEIRRIPGAPRRHDGAAHERGVRPQGAGREGLRRGHRRLPRAAAPAIPTAARRRRFVRDVRERADADGLARFAEPGRWRTRERR